MQKLANFSEKFTPLEYLKNAWQNCLVTMCITHLQAKDWKGSKTPALSMKMLTTCMKNSNEKRSFFSVMLSQRRTKSIALTSWKQFRSILMQTTERSQHPSEICVWPKFKRLKRSLINLRKSMAMLLMFSSTMPGSTCFIQGINHLMMNLRTSRCQEARQLSQLPQLRILRRAKWCHQGNESTIVASVFNNLISGFNYSRKA